MQADGRLHHRRPEDRHYPNQEFLGVTGGRLSPAARQRWCAQKWAIPWVTTHQGRSPMDQELFLIWLYCAIDEAVRLIVRTGRLRARGAQPELTDAEALSIELFGETLGLPSDAAIWRYARAHLHEWFPARGGEWNFLRRCANLHGLKNAILGRVFQHGDWEAFDGLPLPVCRLLRAGRDKCFKGEAASSFCAAKNEYYYGFKAHALLNDHDEICGVVLTAANVDEPPPIAWVGGGGCPPMFPAQRGSS